MESLPITAWYERIENFHDNCVANIGTWPASSLAIRKSMLESYWLKDQSIYEALLLDYGDDQLMHMLEETQEN